MRDALAYEWLRLRTVRSTWLLAAASLLLTVVPALALTLTLSGVPVGIEEQGRAGQEAYATVLTAGAQLAPLLMGLLGAFTFSAGQRLFAYSSRIDPEVPAAFRNDLAPLPGGLALALVVLALLAVAHLLFRRRDA